MEKDREWLTQGEIRSVVHEEMRDALVKQNELLDKIADGAQAQMLSVQILHGNEELGLKGVLPELQERLESVEDRLSTVERGGEARFATLELHLDRLEANQGRFRRTLKRVCEAVTTDEKGQMDTKKVFAVVTAAYAALHVVLGHVKEIWHFIVRVIYNLHSWGF